MRLSFVIPVYNEAPTLAALVAGIFEHARTDDLEIIFVDDGSTDDTPEEIRKLCGKHPQILSIRFGTNAGKTEALKSGFEQANGDIVVTMDSDLQDDPAEIPALLAKLDDGCDLVCGWKEHRHDPRTRVRASGVYNAVVRAVFGIALRDVNCGFKAMRGEVARALIPMLKRDFHRLIPVLAHRAGYRIGEVPVTHHPRRHGRSKYGVERYLRAFSDVVLLKLHPTASRSDDTRPK